ncbi:MAG: MerR family transcriptional regulator [Anaerolineae bacterium]|nr:MerR family transcriptional regulator [Anaerolineae bacterium]
MISIPARGHIMLRIGDFARICRVTPKTLRYYDEIDLLKPNRIDPFTGYRYYTISQLPRLNRILALKDLGLSLEETRLILNDNLTPGEIRGMLKLKEVELEARFADVQARLASVKARLHMIEKENEMPQQEVVFKSIPAQRYLSFRDIAQNVPDQFRKMGETLEKHKIRGWSKDRVVALYYGPPEDGGIDMEVGVIAPEGFTGSVPVEGDLAMTVSDLPAVDKMACLIHKGSYARLGETYQAFWQWIEANGYRIVEPCREVYLNNPDDVPEEEWLTEIQYQLEKA